MRRQSIAFAALFILLPVWTAVAAPLPIRTSLSLDSIHMVTTTVGWAVASGWSPAVFRTTDGGQDWTDVLSHGSPASAAAFLDTQSARVAVVRSTGNGTTGSGQIAVYRTHDAGLHWASSTVVVPPMSVGNVLQLDFADHDRGWLLAGITPGMGHLVYTLWRTADGGAHWTKVAFDLESRRSPGAFPGCNCLSGINNGITFRSSGIGWVTGEPFATSPPWIYVTHDAGRTWSAQVLPRVGGRVVQVTHAPVFVGAVVGYMPVEMSPPGAHHVVVGTYVTRDGGHTWKPTSLVSGTEQATKSVVGFSYSFVAGTQGWIAVHRYFWHTADGGRHWQLLHPTDWRSDIAQIQFLDRSSGLALPARVTLHAPTSYLLRTHDGGRTWQRIPTYSLGRPIH